MSNNCVHCVALKELSDLRLQCREQRDIIIKLRRQLADI